MVLTGALCIIRVIRKASGLPHQISDAKEDHDILKALTYLFSVAVCFSSILQFKNSYPFSLKVSNSDVFASTLNRETTKLKEA